MSKLYFNYGAMGCGKTALLIQVAYNYEEKNQKVIILKPIIDTKGNNNVVSRIGLEREVDYLIKEDDSLLEVLNLVNINAIIVDEAQFLTKSQVDELYYIAKIINIPVLCYGLRCDFQMKGFSGSTRLLEISDSIEELKTICSCGSKATQNLRKINGSPVFDGNQIAIDNTNDITYESVCGTCYLKLRKSKK